MSIIIIFIIIIIIIIIIINFFQFGLKKQYKVKKHQHQRPEKQEKNHRKNLTKLSITGKSKFLGSNTSKEMFSTCVDKSNLKAFLLLNA